MIANSVGFTVTVTHGVARDALAQCNGFRHRTIGVSSAASVVNFSWTWILIKMPEHIHQIIAVNVVSDLLAFVSKNGVMLFGYGAVHQIR